MTSPRLAEREARRALASLFPSVENTRRPERVSTFWAESAPSPQKSSKIPKSKSWSRQTFCYSISFLFVSLSHQSFVYTNNTHATFWNEKNRAKMAILGSKAIFRPYCDLWTVSSTVPSCTVWTVTIFRNDGLTPSFTASTVRPYFDGPYRQPSLHSPDTKPVLNSVLILYWTAYWILNLY